MRLHQGDYDQVTRFSDDPVAQALSWQEQGATVCIGGSRWSQQGEPVNDDAVRAITAALSIPVQLGGGVRSWNGLTTCCVVASTGSFSAVH